MTIWTYAIIRNEEKILPYFLRHYSPWVDRMIFYDGNSTDRTRQILWLNPKAEIRPWLGSDALDDLEFRDFSNEQWKEARGHADWVCWLDADEFLYHPDILEVLGRYLKEGVTVPRVAGFTMASQAFPKTEGQIYDEVKTGFPDNSWSKHVIFRENIHFNVGRHSLDLEKCSPRWSATTEIKLLHYRCLGINYLRERHARNWNRVPERCRQNSLGDNTRPDYVGHHSADWFEDVMKQPLQNVI